jgi:hypothetical protein
MILRCKLDGLLLFAHRQPRAPVLAAYDGGEAFEMERVEAIYYEVAAATRDELLWLETAGYRLLKRSADFELIACRRPA